MKSIENKAHKIFEQLKLLVGKKTYEIFGNHKQVNHIEGENWRNFGETLLTTPKYIFSDDTEKSAGYLLYEKGAFFVVDKKNKNSRIQTSVNHLKKHFCSPVTKDHLVAIAHLAAQENLKIKVKKKKKDFRFKKLNF